MLLGNVVARVVATAKLEALPGRALLEVQIEGQEAPIIAIDAMSAGPGDRVLVLQEGTGAREVLGLPATAALPAQAVVVGIVDAIQQG